MSKDKSTAVDDQVIIDNQAATETADERKKQQALKDYSQAKSNSQLSMTVKVRSPFHDYYVGRAFSVSASSATGPFDILPKHHNFISLLEPCDLIVRATKGDLKISISGGIMHVKADEVSVFLDV